mmetsp:Transcript_16461/g.29148  ORF Transcript_16461/g.29148 Transcript_16461/m.29148 type:complete len:88 (+) Transcript_16461:27-290(+)
MWRRGVLDGVGYVRFYNSLKGQLENEFGNDISFIPSEDKGATGNFEITIVETGKLIHSKTTRGQGRCEKASEVQAVVDEIQAVLDSQ